MAKLSCLRCGKGIDLDTILGFARDLARQGKPFSAPKYCRPCGYALVGSLQRLKAAVPK